MVRGVVRRGVPAALSRTATTPRRIGRWRSCSSDGASSAGWRVLDVACGAGRHARALRGGRRPLRRARSLRAPCCASRSGVTDAPLVRADMRAPARSGPARMDLTVNLFTSFGYFDHDAEHAAALRRDGGDPATRRLVRDRLPERREPCAGGWCRARSWRWTAARCEVTRAVSPDGHYVCKTIDTPAGRRFTERVRLFGAEEIAAMLPAPASTVRHRFGDYDASPHRPRTRPARSSSGRRR